MSHFTAGIDELQADFFHGISGSLRNDGLSEENDSLFRSDTSSLDHDEVMVDDTIVGESSQRSDVLFSQVIESGSVVLDSSDCSLSDPVDLFIEFSSVMESEITSSRDSPSDSSRMP